MTNVSSSTRRWSGTLLVAGVLALVSGLFAPAALAGPAKTPDQTLNDHPSGRDRTGVSGKSGTQGHSPSDPDGMANGGPDKPGGAGGFDADKDGNNGCGNDDDFEDDNNGWCGKRPARVAAATAVQGSSQSHPDGPDGKVQGTEVRGADGSRGTPDATRAAVADAIAATVAALTGQPPAQVLGVELERPTGAGQASETAVLGESLARGDGAGGGSTTPTRVLGAALTGAGGTLALTGFDTMTLVGVACALLVLGTMLTAVRRRQVVPA